MCDPHIFLSVRENLKISPKHHKQEGRFEVSPSIYVTRVFSLTPKIDQLLISLNITPESNIKVTRIKEMITNL